ncbi:MAG TPA: hypothetical protein GX527_06735 [Clostridiaceae bacterium]|nr:hypothetical protein [Clostridiaceae bacterium]
MNSEIVMYQTEDGLTKIETTFDNDTVWLSIDQMAELFQRDKSTISRHIKNVFNEGELIRNSVVANFATTAADGKTYQVDYYNLDVIISVGYRVKSLRGTQFRIWASNVLKEYMRKGFAMNDDLLKNNGGGIYFDELLDRIRDIRSSEKVFWRKVLDIYATSVDYDPRMEVSSMFFKTVQNKMHWAAHGQTAAEKIYYSADADKPFMGMLSFKGERPAQSDALVAKNYCTEEELSALNSAVSAYLEFAEMQARRRIPMYMSDWIQTLDGFLKLSKHEILTHAGKISAKTAELKAKEEYKKFKAFHLEDVSNAEKDYIKALEEMEMKLLGEGKGKNEAGLNRFVLSVKQWTEKTSSRGIIAKAGRYGGTYAHETIAFEFASWVSPQFKLFLIKEFQRLKEAEYKQLGWDIKRNLAKINYRIHTDAIKENLIPPQLTPQVNQVYANEADVLNVTLFGMSAKQWRDANPELKGNIRDYANVSQLVCLSNMENLNSQKLHLT